MTVSQRCYTDTTTQALSCLAAYRRLAPQYELAPLGALPSQWEFARQIWSAMSLLSELIQRGGEEGLKFKRLGTGLAEVFATYYAGIGTCDGVVSNAGRQLMIALAVQPPHSSWVPVLQGGIDGRISAARQRERARTNPTVVTDTVPSSATSCVDAEYRRSHAESGTNQGTTSVSLSRTCGTVVNRMERESMDSRTLLVEQESAVTAATGPYRRRRAYSGP